MRAISRLSGRISLAAIAALMLAIAACGGNGGEETSDRSESPQKLVSNNALGVLAASAAEFEQEVRSVRADFTFDMDAPGFDLGATGEIAFQAPDGLHMTMEMSGGGESGFNLGDIGAFEIIALGENVYMNTSFTGWVQMSLDDLGADAESIRKALSGNAPFDYRSLIDSIGGEIEDLGEADGQQHYRVTVDLADVIGALTDSLGSNASDGSDGLPTGLNGPIVMDIWMDRSTLLPQRFEADGEFDMDGESLGFAMQMTFSNYNESIDLPEPPSDAKSLSELLGDMDFDADYDGDGEPRRLVPGGQLAVAANRSHVRRRRG